MLVGWLVGVSTEVCAVSSSIGQHAMKHSFLKID